MGVRSGAHKLLAWAITRTIVKMERKNEVTLKLIRYLLG
jgi:hypothetical protein